MDTKLHHGISEGDEVTYKLKNGESRIALVTQIFDDMGDGRPGFNGIMETKSDEQFGFNEAAVWGYFDQVTEVLKCPE